jgi:cob(I)alamin adenosyltransferase
MKIYTRTGDSGDTGLFGGKRISKSSARIAAIGAADEANAALGLARSLGLPEELSLLTETLQERLFDLGADLSMPQAAEPRMTAQRVAELESLIDRYEAGLEPLRNFILPGGSPGAAALHVARGACRRAEREIAALHAEEPLRQPLLAFINRLSDLLFILARAANRCEGVADTIWKSR